MFLRAPEMRTGRARSRPSNRCLMFLWSSQPAYLEPSRVPGWLQVDRLLGGWRFGGIAKLAGGCLECAAKEQRGGAHGQQGESEKEGEIRRNGHQPGVLQHEVLETMHGISKRINDGDRFHPSREC